MRVFISLFVASSFSFAQAPPVTDLASRLDNAHELIIAGKVDQAITALQAARKENPDNLRITRELGLAYYRKNQFSSAVTELKSVLSRDPNDKEAIQLAGLSLYFTGAQTEAISYLEKSTAWFPSATLNANYVLGLAYLETRQYDNALRAFATTYGVAPNSAAGNLMFARMLLAQNDDGRSEEYVRKAVELDPKLPLAHHLLGEFLVVRHDIPGAIREFEAELTINPANANTYYKLADAYSRAERWDDAHRMLQQSIWLDSTWTGPYILMGRVLLKKNENVLAVRTLRKAISMDPKNDLTHFLLGQALRASGDEQNAQKEFGIARELKAASNQSDQEILKPKQ